MSSKIEVLDKNMVLLTVEVPVEDFRAAMKQAYEQTKKSFSIPGFRKGKAPMQLVLNHYGESVLYERAFDLVSQKAYSEALEEQGEEPYSAPQVDIIAIGMDKGVTFTAEFARKPEVKLGEYKGVTAYCPAVEVEESEIDKRLENERKKLSRLVSVERPIEENDIVNIDYCGKIDGVAFEGGTGDNYDLTIGSKTFIPGFEDQLIGHQTGDEVEVKVTFPTEYHAEELAGKDAVFTTKINGVEVRELPELDDEFIKDISEDCDTVSQYRDQLRQQMQEDAEKRSDAEFTENALKQAVENAEIEIPEIVIDTEMNRMVEEQRRRMQSMGLPLEQYLQYLNMDMHSFKMTLHEPALYRVRSELVIEKIAELENVEVTEADFEEQFEEMAKEFKRDLAEIKETYDNESIREYLKQDIIRKKVSALVKEAAVKTDVKPETVDSCGCGHDHKHDENCGCELDHEHDENCGCEINKNKKTGCHHTADEDCDCHKHADDRSKKEQE